MRRMMSHLGVNLQGVQYTACGGEGSCLARCDKAVPTAAILATRIILYKLKSEIQMERVVKDIPESKMFRAVERKGFDPSMRHFPRATRRLPSNVPYVVDNIWEWLRPAGAPSRRHAIYASPTPTLALRNASGGGASRENYIVCELRFFGPACKIAQLKVTDARLHPDIANIIRCIHHQLDEDFASQLLHDKLYCGPLFMPCASREELAIFFETGIWNSHLATLLNEISCFWTDADLTIQPCNEGEMFFEMQPATYFTLDPVDSFPPHDARPY